MNYYNINGWAQLTVSIKLDTDFEAPKKYEHEELINKVEEYAAEIEQVIKNHYKNRRDLVAVECLIADDCEVDYGRLYKTGTC